MKTDYKKIDIYLKDSEGIWNYECSTTWSKTCKEAKEIFLLKSAVKEFEEYVSLEARVRARYAKDGEPNTSPLSWQLVRWAG